MYFQQLYTAFATYQATKNIKRYVVNAALGFGKTYVLPLPPPMNLSIKAPAPANGKLKIYNSFKELTAQTSYNGVAEYIDIKANPEFKDIILEPSVVKALMEFDGNPYQWLQQNSFSCSVMWRGVRKYFRYNPKEMLMYLSYSEDPETFKAMKAAAELEKTISQWTEKAQRNARALAAIAKNKSKLNPAQQTALQKEIVNHQYAVNEMKASLPKGFFMQSASLSADKINGVRTAQIGVIPVVVWVVAIISTAIVTGGLIAYTQYINKKAEVEKRKNLLDANLQNINAIAAAGILKNKGLIDNDTYNQITTAANNNMNSNNQAVQKYTDADTREQDRGDFMSKLQNVLLIGGVIIIGSKLLKNSNG